jgi:hypothetical protein
MQNILRLMDCIVGVIASLCGFYFLVCSLDILEAVGREESMVRGLIFRVLGSAILICTGFYLLMRFSASCGPRTAVEARSSPPAPKPISKLVRRTSARCPKPPTPSGPIHVVEVAEEPEDCSRKWKVATKKRRNRKRPKSADSDTVAMDVSTEISPSERRVPDTIAAIWEAIPGHRSNIWAQ